MDNCSKGKLKIKAGARSSPHIFNLKVKIFKGVNPTFRTIIEMRHKAIDTVFGVYLTCNEVFETLFESFSSVFKNIKHKNKDVLMCELSQKESCWGTAALCL